MFSSGEKRLARACRPSRWLSNPWSGRCKDYVIPTPIVLHSQIPPPFMFYGPEKFILMFTAARQCVHHPQPDETSSCPPVLIL